MTHNKILVLSRELAEGYDWNNSDVAIISITDPNKSDANLKCSEDRILRLKFYDIDKDTEIWTPEGNVFVNAMNKNQAKLVSEFLSKWFKNVKELVVHCEAGVSRSAGTAAAIAKYFYNDDMEYFKSNGRYVPNRNCYRLVLNEFIGSIIDYNIPENKKYNIKWS